MAPETVGVPVVGVLVQGLWGIALCAGGYFVFGVDLGFLLDGVVFVDWLFFALCGAALLRLRARGAGDADGGFRTPLVGPVCVAFTVLALLVMAGSIWTSPAASSAGLGLCAAGLPFFARLRAAGRGPRGGMGGLSRDA